MNRMWVRLTLAFSVVVLLGVVAVGAIGFLLTDVNIRRHILVREVQDPGGLIDTLSAHYQTNNSWDGVDALLRGAQATFPLRPRGGLAFIVTDDLGHVVYTTHRWNPAQPVETDTPVDGLPIQVEGRMVGYLRVEPIGGPGRGPGMHRIENPSYGGPGEKDLRPGDSVGGPPFFDEFSPSGEPPSPDVFFLHTLSRTMLWIALLVGILGILFGVVMGRTLTAPLRHLAEAAQAIGARDFSRRVEARGTEEVREVAQAFNKMVDDLEQAEILRRNLLADVAHELRTPLSVVQGNLRAILDEVYPMEQEEIARLYDQTRLLGRLVEDLHELAQAEAKQLPLNLRPVELGELVRDVVETFGPAAQAEEINLSMDIPDDLPAVQVDPARMTQVLHNLLSNALRHTPSGGTVSVSAGRGEDSVWLAVQDTGEGIPLEDLSHVFDRFYRVDRARARGTGGTGLGLAIVRAIVEMHGGKVWADSDGVPGHGSRFTIQIPIGGSHTGLPVQEKMLT